MIEDIEYVDPDKDKCAECSCGFGVHLTTCSHFYMCAECRSTGRGVHFFGCSQRKEA
jgi:hypothetical protein